MIKIVKNDLLDYAERLHTASDNVANDYADKGVDIARDIVPIDSGDLQSSIRKREVAHAQYQIVAGDPSADVDYHSAVEFGSDHDTYQIAPQPYMTPTSEQLRAPFIAAAKRELKP